MRTRVRYEESVPCRTIMVYSFSETERETENEAEHNEPIDKPGAMSISCFFVRMRKKTSSLLGSMSRMVERALSARDLIRAAYCCVTVPSRLERMGMPNEREYGCQHTVATFTPDVNSTSNERRKCCLFRRSARMFFLIFRRVKPREICSDRWLAAVREPIAAHVDSPSVNR